MSPKSSPSACGKVLLTNVALKSQGLSNLVNADERCVSNLTENSGKDLREGSAETGETESIVKRMKISEGGGDVIVNKHNVNTVAQL